MISEIISFLIPGIFPKSFKIDNEFLKDSLYSFIKALISPFLNSSPAPEPLPDKEYPNGKYSMR